MMQLVGTNGSSLSLGISGYQFPGRRLDPSDFDYDANWLVVEGRADDGSRAWKFRDACLFTTEAQDLVKWLRDSAKDEGSEALEFLEPNLEFRRIPSDGDAQLIRVYFRLEMRPVSDATDGDWDGSWIDLRVPSDALVKAAQALELDIERFPQR